MKTSKKGNLEKSSNTRKVILLGLLGLGAMAGAGILNVRDTFAGQQTLAKTKANNSSALSHRIVWRTPADGFKESQQTQKPILYDITAEWCGPCHRLTSVVFENASCAAWINQRFIPVRVLDRRREEGSNPQDVADLEAKYQLQGFPTIVIQYPGKPEFKKLVGYYGREGTMAFLKQTVQ